MAWKNLSSLADSMIVAHNAIKELDELVELIDWSRIEQHLAHIHAKARGKKPGHLY